MATIKSVSSKCPVGGIINYVTKEEKTEEQLISGKDCSPETAKDEMEATKKLWGKTGGRTYKHFVQSFHKDENITPQEAHELAKAFAEQCRQFEGYEVLIATHKDREHIHTHFVVNSVSFEDGTKFQMSKRDLQSMKDLSDQLCCERGLHICEKGKTFEGAVREEATIYNKDEYAIMQKAERGEVEYYKANIALSIMNCRERATSRADFIEKMNEKGYGVEWKDNHKYVVYIDLERQARGEVKDRIRDNTLGNDFHIDFRKDTLEHEFERNARERETSQSIERTAELISVGAVRQAERNDRLSARADRRTGHTDRQADSGERPASSGEQTATERSIGAEIEARRREAINLQLERRKQGIAGVKQERERAKAEERPAKVGNRSFEHLIGTGEVGTGKPKKQTIEHNR